MHIGRPEDDHERNRRERFSYDLLENFEARGVVERHIRPPSGPSGKPPLPPRTLPVSDWERRQTELGNGRFD